MAPRKVLHRVPLWETIQLTLRCMFLGAWQLLKLCFKKLWKGHRRKSNKNFPPVQLIDSAIGTHCYIKVMGVKYHYVEAGSKYGDILLILGDAPGVSAASGQVWASIINRLAESGYRVIALDLRGTGGSEGGNRRELSPPRVVDELHALVQALGVSENNPVTLVGHGIGGMLTWYLVHCHGNLISKFVIIGAPHPNLYWQYPPSAFCKNILHFIQWPYLPECWLAENDFLDDDSSASELWRWAGSRACDWTGALNYIRGAAWWRISKSRRADPPALLVGERGCAAEVIASAEYCASPTLRLVSCLTTALDTSSPDLQSLILNYLIEEEKSANGSENGRGLMGRVFGAVAGRGREITAAVNRARLILPTPG